LTVEEGQFSEPAEPARKRTSAKRRAAVGWTARQAIAAGKR
jgi:hypothetical protein